MLGYALKPHEQKHPDQLTLLLCRAVYSAALSSALRYNTVQSMCDLCERLEYQQLVWVIRPFSPGSGALLQAAELRGPVAP